MPALLEDEYETGIETWQDGHLAGVAWAIEELELLLERMQLMHKQRTALAEFATDLKEGGNQ